MTSVNLSTTGTQVALIDIISWHESSHFVIFNCHGIPVKSLSIIEQTDEQTGHCGLIGYTRRGACNTSPIAMATGIYAGAAGEALLTGVPIAEVLRSPACRRDATQAAIALSRLARPVSTANLIARTTALVRQEMPQIERLAQALRESRYLDGDTAAAIIGLPDFPPGTSRSSAT